MNVCTGLLDTTRGEDGRLGAGNVPYVKESYQRDCALGASLISEEALGGRALDGRSRSWVRTQIESTYRTSGVCSDFDEITPARRKLQF